MTEYKSITKGAVLVVKEPTEVVRDWPTYYYNTERYREYVKRKAWHRRGRIFESPYTTPASFAGVFDKRGRMRVKLAKANEFIDNLRK